MILVNSIEKKVQATEISLQGNIEDYVIVLGEKLAQILAMPSHLQLTIIRDIGKVILTLKLRLLLKNNCCTMYFLLLDQEEKVVQTKAYHYQAVSLEESNRSQLYHVWAL